MPTTSSTPNVPGVAYRGVRFTTSWGFWEDDDHQVPIVPYDTTAYPRVQVIDPSGNVVLTRTPPSVRPGNNPGYWAFDFDVPPDAAVTGVNQHWTFAAEVIDANSRRTVYTTTFLVKDPAVVKSGNQSRFYSTVHGQELTIMYKSVVPLYSITLDVVNTIGSDANMYLVQTAVLGNSANNIKYVQSEGVHVYMYTIRAQQTPGFTLQDFIEGPWQAHWKVQESPAHIPDLVYQIIHVFHRSILTYVGEVMFIVDKLEKRMTTRQGYDESDILGGLNRGIQLINSVFPFTSWTLMNLPGPAQPYVILAAAWWIVMGQLGLAVDLQFSFSGQRVSLDQDQTGGLGDMLERYRSALWDQFKEVKEDLVRNSEAVGMVATRPQRGRRLSFMVSSSSASNQSFLAGWLGSIGILI